MDMNIVLVHGLPGQSNPIKLKLKFQKECEVVIKSIKLNASSNSAEIEFANTEDCNIFCEKLPKSMSFGNDKHILTLERKGQQTGSDTTEKNAVGVVERKLSEGSDTADDNSSKVTPTLPKFDFNEINTWSDIEYMLQCKRSGIIVQPTDTVTSPQDIWEYFEDKQQSHGGPLQALYPMADGIFLSFRNPETVESVWNFRPHRIKGKPVTVYEKVVPIARKFVVAIQISQNGSDKAMTEEKLQRLLKSCSSKSISPKEVTKSGNERFRVVYDKEKIDEENVKAIVDKFNKDHSSHTALFLLETDCVQVLPFPKDVTNGELRTLFESKIVTSGGCVTAISRDQNFLLVHFSSYKDAHAVVVRHGGKSLPLFGVSMKIQPYFPILMSKHGSLESSTEMKKYYDVWLARKGLSSELSTEPPQSPFVYLAVDNELLQFLRASPAANKLLNETLCGVGTAKMTQDGVEVALKKHGTEMENATTKKIQQFLANYATETIKVQDDTTRKMIDKRMAKAKSQDKVCLKWQDGVTKKDFIITGLKAEVDTVLSNVKPRENTDYLKVDDGHMNWLQETKVFQELIAQHPVISGLEAKNEIRFVGEPDKIKEARNAIQGKLKALKYAEFTSPEKMFTKFLEDTKANRKIAATVARILHDSDVQAVLYFDSESGKPFIVGTEKSCQDAMMILNRALAIDTTLQLSIAEMNATQPPPWEYATMQEKDGRIMMRMKGDFLCIVGFRESVMEVSRRLSELSKEHKTPYQMDHGAARYVVKYVTEFTSFCSTNSVAYAVTATGIVMTGKKSKIEEAMAILGRWKDRVMKLSEMITDGEEIKFFENEEGKRVLETAGRKYRSILLTSVKSQSQLGQSSVMGNPVDESINIGRVKLSVRQGDLAEDGNDVIVNTVGYKFDLNSGQLSQAILTKGGLEIQQELESKPGVIRFTTNGKLKCKRIIHAVFPINMKEMGSRLTEILKLAEMRKFTSISLPPIGTGAGKKNCRFVAEMMVNSFREFAKTPGQYLTKADVVILESNKMIEFRKELMFHSGLAKEAHSSRRSAAEQQQSWQIGSLTVSVKRGDITEIINYAIVNSVGSDFLLGHGQVSKIILKKGGHHLQRELDAARDELIRVTRSGKLTNCSKIIHVVAPNADVIKECAIAILRRADGEGCTTLSIPAIGTGNLGYSVPEVARLMVKAIREFTNENPATSSLKKIDFVIFRENDYRQFRNTFFAATSVQGEFDISSKSSGISSSVELQIFAADKRAAEEAQKFVRDKVDAAMDLVLRNDFISKMGERERERLRMLEKQFDVKITWSDGKIIVRSGKEENKLGAKEAVAVMLENMSQLAIQQPSQSSDAMWEYADTMGNWRPFELTDCQKLEEGYQKYMKGASISTVRVGDLSYNKTVSFYNMKMGSDTNVRRNENRAPIQAPDASSRGTNHSYNLRSYGNIDRK